MYRCQYIGYDPNIAERPKAGGSSVRPRWKQSVPQYGNQTTSTGRMRFKSNSESVEVCRTPCGQNNTWSPNTIEDRSTGGVALPEGYPSTGPTPIPTVWCLVVCKPEIPNPAVQCRGIPPPSGGGGCQEVLFVVRVRPLDEPDARPIRHPPAAITDCTRRSHRRVGPRTACRPAVRRPHRRRRGKAPESLERRTPRRVPGTDRRRLL